MKDRTKKKGIPWENLEKLNSKKEIINQLKIHWGSLSDRGTHSTQNSTQNPLRCNKLNNIIQFLNSDST